MGLFGKNTNIKPQAEDIPVPMVTINPSGTILFANKAIKKFFGTENLENLKITDLIKSDLPSMIDGSNHQIEKAFKTYGEKEKYVEITTKEVNHLFVMTFVDVTQDYLLMDNLLKYRKDTDNFGKNKNRFLSQMSNVLKSPMHSIMGYSQAILEGMGGQTDERQRKYLEVIYRDSHDLFKLIDKIVELSKAEAQLMNFSYKNFDITNLLNQIYSEYSQKAKEKGLDFVISTDDLSQKVLYGEENILKQIIEYLIEAAFLSCNFGTVRVVLSDKEFAEKNENKINIRVLDAGTKMKESEIPTTYNPYYQPDKKHRTTLLKSLCICVAGNLISSLNGSVTVETEVSGFSVIIPTDKSVEKSVRFN